VLAPTVGILILTPEGFQIPVSEIDDRARAALESKTLLEIAPADLFSEEVRLEVVRTCAGSAACFLEKFGQTSSKVDVLLVLTIADLPDRRLVAARTVRARDGNELARAAHEVSKDAPLAGALDVVLSQVFAEGWGRVGSIAVTTTPPGARAELGARTCLTPCRFDRIPLDLHAIALSKEGFVPASRSVDVRGPITVDVVLDPEPEPWVWYESPWIWTAVGVVVVGASVGTYFALREPPPDDVCITGDPSECAR
jgi:hypothetical protein